MSTRSLDTSCKGTLRRMHECLGDDRETDCHTYITSDVTRNLVDGVPEEAVL